MLSRNPDRAGPYRPALRRALLRASLALLPVLSCRGAFDPTDYNPDWTTPSHGLAPANYPVVVPDDSVNRIDIIMTAADWAAIRQNMIVVWGFDFGDGTQTCYCRKGDDPAYVDIRVRFNGKEWKHVGFRLKGGGSLHHSWNRGIYKLPFRLKFDEFEDQHPETWNQRFYGFRELTMAPGVDDQSLIREKVAGELFRRAGVPAPRAAFYRVYVDFGGGLQYNGLYTMVEAVEDNMLRDQFGENTGNLYKPVSDLRTFSEWEFPRQNNDTSRDYRDVQGLVAALNNNALRASSPAQWRAGLEAVFDVDHFLKFLGVSTTIMSWDGYGTAKHNFYLYHHSSRKLLWIPWDQDHTLSLNSPFDQSFSQEGVDSSWPLIRYLIDDPIYYARYRSYLRAFYENVFTTERTSALFDKYHAMIAPYVVGPLGEQPGRTFITSNETFFSSLPELKTFVDRRRSDLEVFLR